MIWIKRQQSDQDLRIKTLVKEFNIDALKASIFIKRDIDIDQIKFFDNDMSLNNLHSPFLFEDMIKLIERVITAEINDEKILLFGDRDVDGITSTVLFYSYLKKRGLNVSYKVPAGDQNYGFSTDIIKEFKKENGKLLIALDCGTVAFKEIDYANELGIDVMIIDHHNPQNNISPSALAIINPKIGDYPFKGLCTASLAWKVIYGLEFANTDFYNKIYNLIYIKKIDEEDAHYQVLSIKNMITIREKDGIISLDKNHYDSDFYSFFNIGDENLVYLNCNEDTEVLNKVFNKNPIVINDISIEFQKDYPALKNMSLKDILKKSKFARYKEEDKLKEIYALREIFNLTLVKHLSFLKEYYKYIDFVTIASIADMMPLKDENRIIIKHGLRYLEQTENVALKSLLLKVGLIENIEYSDVGWRIAPVINSAGRMGRPDVAIEYFLNENVDSDSLNVIMGFNNKRRALNNEVWDAIINNARENYIACNEKMVYVYDEYIPRGITGILANNLVQKFNVIAIVFTKISNTDNLMGSVRSPDIKVVKFLENAKELLNDFGGHDAAGGFSLNEKNKDEFIERLKKSINEIDFLKEEDKLYYDLEFPNDYLNNNTFARLVKLNEDFKPFGQDWQDLTFYFKDALIKDVSILKEKYLKLTLQLDSLIINSFIWRNINNYILKINSKASIIFQLEKNVFRGTVENRLKLIDIKIKEIKDY